MIECASDGDSATLYQYSSTDCTGDTVNETDVEYFYCGSSSDCTLTTIEGTVYNSSGNCSGDATGTAQFNIAQISDCISVYDGYVSYLLEIDDDSMYISSYLYTGSCDDDYVQFNLTLMDGCNEIGDGESVDATFGTYSITQPGDDDDDDTDAASKIGIPNTLTKIFSVVVVIIAFVALDKL